MRRLILRQAPPLTALLQRMRLSSTTQSGGRSPFQKTGTETPYEEKETKENYILRIDMPGCPGSDLACWVDSKAINFYADEPPDAELDHSGRRYGGTFVVKSELYNVKETRAKLVNGVLWITVPKHAKKPTS